MQDQLLLVEDNNDIAEIVSTHASDMGMQVTHCNNGRNGLELALSQPWDVVILDVMLPEVTGTEICRQLRKQSDDVPILMLTARDSELDHVLGLELGADDYVTKPFSISELMARIRALRRRATLNPRTDDNDGEVLSRSNGEVIICPSKRNVQVDGEQKSLTAREFDLLLQLATEPGRVFKRDELLEAVWGKAYSGYEHCVNSHVNRLRGKIEPEPSKPKYVQTVRGVGYRFCDEQQHNQ